MAPAPPESFYNVKSCLDDENLPLDNPPSPPRPVLPSHESQITLAGKISFHSPKQDTTCHLELSNGALRYTAHVNPVN